MATKPNPLHGFTPADLRAFGEGRKTQYRVPVKPQPKHPDLGYMAVEGGALQCGADYPDGDDDFVKCPLGKPGDRLFVTEAWRKIETGIHAGKADYKADDPSASGIGFIPWKSPRTMPSWAARYWCEIVAVRVERIQDISIDDSGAEGVQVPVSQHGGLLMRVTGKFLPHDYLPAGFFLDKAPLTEERIGMVVRAHFASAWNARHGAGAWERNDWVWCLTLKKVEGAK